VSNRQVFEALVLPHLDAAYNLARWLLRSEQAAEDAVQEASMRAFRYIETLRGDDARPWLLGIVRNTCFTMLERTRNQPQWVDFDEAEFEAALGERSLATPIREVQLQRRTRLQIDAAIRALARRCAVIVLREFEGSIMRDRKASPPCRRHRDVAPARPRQSSRALINQPGEASLMTRPASLIRRMYAACGARHAARRHPHADRAGRCRPHRAGRTAEADTPRLVRAALAHRLGQLRAGPGLRAVRAAAGAAPGPERPARRRTRGRPRARVAGGPVDRGGFDG
jgi:RNA polymerase sigma-70 factor (ECF subfamily)